LLRERARRALRAGARLPLRAARARREEHGLAPRLPRALGGRDARGAARVLGARAAPRDRDRLGGREEAAPRRGGLHLRRLGRLLRRRLVRARPRALLRDLPGARPRARPPGRDRVESCTEFLVALGGPLLQAERPRLRALRRDDLRPLDVRGPPRAALRARERDGPDD